MKGGPTKQNNKCHVESGQQQEHTHLFTILILDHLLGKQGACGGHGLTQLFRLNVLPHTNVASLESQVEGEANHALHF